MTTVSTPASSATSNYGVYTVPPVVVTDATLTLVDGLHGGRIISQKAATGCTMTLPAATGSGTRFKVIVKTTITSGGLIIKVANASDTMIGNAFTISDNSAGVLGYIATAGTSDTITLNGTTSGGYTGDFVELVDIDTNVWQVLVMSSSTSTEETPFSATVS